MASDEGTWCKPWPYFLCNEIHTQLSYIRGQFCVLDSNWALFDVQISFSPPGIRRTEHQPRAQPCWEGILPWEQTPAAGWGHNHPELHIPLNVGLDTVVVSNNPGFPLRCLFPAPQSFHLVLKSITQSRALIQLKNTHKNQGMETGKGAMGRECSELFLPWSHNPDVLGLLSSYQDEDWAAWHIRLDTAIKHKCLLTKTAFALRRWTHKYLHPPSAALALI